MSSRRRSKDVIIIKGRNIWPYDLEVLAQQTGGVKLGGVAAFSVSLDNNEEQAVLVVETKEKDADKRLHIIEDISRSIHAHFGINVRIDLTPRGTLPRTSSGKLSRSQSKQDYLARKTLLDVEKSAAQGWRYTVRLICRRLPLPYLSPALLVLSGSAWYRVIGSGRPCSGNDPSG